MIRRALSVRRLARSFPDTHARWYVACKLASDPLYRAVHGELKASSAPLLDLGCGMGLLAFYLRQHGWNHPLRGIDYDPRKIAAAHSVMARTGATGLHFQQGDARSGLPDHCGSVTILDILQYCSPDEQERLLTAAAARTAPGGVLIIRSGMDTDGWRFRLTRCCDRMANHLRWMQAPPVHYPTLQSLRQPLENAGMVGEIRPLWGRTPFNNWLAVFRRG